MNYLVGEAHIQVCSEIDSGCWASPPLARGHNTISTRDGSLIKSLNDPGVKGGIH